jgi:hypothetical protein
MRIIAQSLLFILNKWNLSMDEFNPIGKFLWYIPNFLNNVLTQIFYFCLFPFVCLYFYLHEKSQLYILMYKLFLILLKINQ